MRQISHKAEEASVTPASVAASRKRTAAMRSACWLRSFERMKQSLAISMQMLKDRQKAAFDLWGRPGVLQAVALAGRR